MKALVLGSTHYPLLKYSIQEILNDGEITLVDSPQLVAEYVANGLRRSNLIFEGNSASEHHFYVSDYTDTFQTIARYFFGENIPLEELNIW
jgi:glutamate racemase